GSVFRSQGAESRSFSIHRGNCFSHETALRQMPTYWAAAVLVSPQSPPMFKPCPNARRRLEMNMSKKSLKLAGALAIVLGAASPLMATFASAAPYGHESYG